MIIIYVQIFPTHNFENNTLIHIIKDTVLLQITILLDISIHSGIYTWRLGS